MLVAYVPIELLAHRCPFWVRLTQIAIPSGWLGDRTWVAGSSLLHYDDLDRIRLTGVTTEDDMVGLPIGTVVQFLRRNVREIG